MAPRADFACLSKKCDTPEGATIYELPVGAVRCPVCGSKRVKRLFNAVNIATGRAPDHFNAKDTSSSHAARLDSLAEPAMVEALRKRDEVAFAQRHHPMVRPTPMRQLGGVLQQVYQGNGAAGVPAVDASALTTKAALGGSAHPVIQDLQGARMPREVIAADREYKIVKGKDGPEVARA